MSLTSVIRYIRAVDTSSSTGAGKTGLAFGDFTAKYLVPGGVLTSLTPQDITTLGTYEAPTANTNIRIKELNSADPTKGVYEVHFHNDHTANESLVLFLSAAGALIIPYEFNLTLERFQIADTLLLRNVNGGSNSGRLVKHALAKLRNRWDVYDNAGTPTMRIYDTDDTTVLWEEALSTATSGDVITQANPTT